MMLHAWFPSGAALLSRYECTLSQISACPDITLDVARMQNNKQTSLNVGIRQCHADKEHSLADSSLCLTSFIVVTASSIGLCPLAPPSWIVSLQPTSERVGEYENRRVNEKRSE